MFSLSLWTAVFSLAVGSTSEAVVLLPPDETIGTWSLSVGPEFPGAQGRLEIGEDGVLRLHYDFTNGGAYVAAVFTFREPLTLRSVAFRLRKPPEGRLTFRVADASGQGLQKSVRHAVGGWQQLEANMTNWTGHWGGADDGLLHPPLSQIAFLIESNGLFEPTGTVEIADVTARLGSPDAETSVHRGTYVVTSFDDEAGFVLSGPSRLESGVWTADFARADLVALHHSISLLGTPREIILRVRGGSSGNILKLRLGSHFQTFERVVGTLDGGAKTFRVPMPPEGWDHFGGENDGIVRYPLRVTALLLERGTGLQRETAVELVELRAVTEVLTSDVVRLVARNTDPGDTSTLRAACTLWNLLDRPLEGTLTTTVRDWEGAILSEEVRPWTLPANGIPSEARAEVPIPADRNFIEVGFVFKADGIDVQRAVATFTRESDDPGDATLKPESPWGMGIYLYRYPHTPEGHAAMDRAAALAQAAGVKWSREEFQWARIEPEPGEYDFSFYDVVVETAQRHGISVYGLLAYWSSWTAPYTEQGIDDFVRWARVVVRRYKDRIKHWEIYNEPNIFFWSGPKDLYPVLLRRAYEAIKEEDPEAQVLGISTAGIDRGFIEFCLDAGAPFDILTIHPYRSVLIERAFMRELREVAELVDNRPVWITEMGWSTQIGGVNERRQARLLARAYLAAVASGASQNVSWYDFRSDGRDPFYNEHNFGVLRHDMTQKPAYRALMTVARTLSEGEPVLRDEFGKRLLALQMGDALALWSPMQAMRVELKAMTGSVVARNLMGETVASAEEGETCEVSLHGKSPVFLTGGHVEPTGNVVAIEDPEIPLVIRF